MTHYFIFAGELSGDLHGSRLIQALKKENPSSCFSGIGGPQMRKEDFDCLFPMEQFQVMGFSDVLVALPRLWKLFYQIKDKICRMKPDCVILIDYPGFNLRLARALRQGGYQGKIVQYICPTIWAHGKNRIQTLISNYDLLLTIFPFESSYFSNTPLRVEYIGNPLVETIRNHEYQSEWLERLGISSQEKLIALFPGSRRGEIQKHLSQQLQVASELKARHPELRFALSCAQESLYPLICKYAHQSSLRMNEDLFIVPSHYHYELMKTCYSALAKSGTVTLELAIHQVPTIVHYDLSLLNYLFAKYVLRLQLPHYCIVNILAQKKVFPEFVGRGISSKDILADLEHLHFHSSARNEIQSLCKSVVNSLRTHSTHQSAAKAILELKNVQ